MTTCEHLTMCHYISSKLETSPATAQLLKGAYCKGHPAECARYKVARISGIETVPLDLSPSDDDIAERLLSVHNC
ncbi:hypothetical protein OR1_01616 [Geobacter sp. OR-1]|nr:hypothetical protein OR1_01616 [Geobacter sp. OR-1]